ncbi:DUF4139 domain-containing protein [Gemmata sp.]|uniref:DUF4139 domain-containing protein n=1 Tax=Gemmata sp. TaxID=1914242 RepID=UPI003F6F6140
MMRRTLAWCLPVLGAGVAAGIGADRLVGATHGAAAKHDVKPAVSLPVTRVVLFNCGVGYFSRSGEVTDDARVDLAFPEHDVNDLLKSMTLEDFGGGRVAAVSYDSREPVSRTLGSFAVNLDGNPTLDALVSQMRGERVEAAVAPGAGTQGGKLSGVIVGVERRRLAAAGGEAEAAFVNLWCAEGLRSVRLADVQHLRFANPVIENEFRRALDVLAASHDAQKKAVSLHFAGDGRRKVQVGYVVEAPIWKTSYRMVLSDKEKPYLQGWALVENTTDEDWAGVKMALISGRPISFQMNLHDPLYLNRPTVEPELFASLRPVAYRRAVGHGLRLNIPALGPLPLAVDLGPPLNNGPGDHKQPVNISVGVFGSDGAPTPPPTLDPIAPPPPPGVNLQGVSLQGHFKAYHELVKQGKYAAAEQVALAAQRLDPNNPAIGALVTMARTQKRVAEEQHLGSDKERMVYGGLTDADPRRPDLRSFAQYDVSGLGAHLDARTVAQELATPVATGSVGNAATAAALGDAFQYAIDHPVSLARQKSAMLPIVGKAIEGQKVSIYNEAVQRTHPLLGLRFKNTSGAHLNQGPITVFEGSVYAGDTRVLDVQPNEERLVSYAIDLGTEVDPQRGAGSQKVTSVKAVKGLVTVSAKLTEEKTYRVTNRSRTDRTLLIEHPNRTNDQFKLVGTDKPVEDTPDVYRFQVAVRAGESKSLTVTEERVLANEVTLTNDADDAIRYFTTLAETSPGLKRQLQQAAKVREAWDAARREQGQVLMDLARLNADQERIRQNLRETPKEAEVYATYLKKLSDQEKEIDALTEKQKSLAEAEFKARGKYEAFLANISD